ncbi:sulfur carrier protein ThiS [Mesobaculum littorinae]|uniref:Sulfur carrier protein ThiS n=1 Tax=Mesobaculum littorinae TaxID=2486419 RepID=A0A438AMR2_9RHOB|nr:sulfur carrier protein ThiS [Mesobaculum littorinae]RVV99972.1 sulfur carrier protein ThiS [Mesobaculum littorinae]
MQIMLNGEPRDIAATTLAAALDELGYGEARVATAVNETFVPAPLRDRLLAPGDRVEVLTPRQGG